MQIVYLYCTEGRFVQTGFGEFGVKKVRGSYYKGVVEK